MGAISKDELRRHVKFMRESMRNPDGSSVTQMQLAPILGVGLSTLQRYEQLAPPRGKMLFRLARIAAEHASTELPVGVEQIKDLEVRKSRLRACADVFLQALSEELGPRGTPGAEALPWELEAHDSTEWLFMKIARLLARDPQYKHLWKPFFELTSEIVERIRQEDRDLQKLVWTDTDEVRTLAYGEQWQMLKHALKIIPPDTAKHETRLKKAPKKS